MSPSSIVRLERITKVFRQGEIEVVALDDVSLEVAEREFVVVVGPSGSGKTTLLHVIAGLLPATRGRALVCERDLTRLSDGERARLRRRRVGVVFQSFNLLPTLTAAENVALPLLLDGIRPAEVEAHVDEMLRRVGLHERGRHMPDALSGGECQRVAIARALVTAPALVLADEPTGNLDGASGRLVLDLLREANRTLRCTVVLVTHDARARAYGTRVVRLEDGQVRDHAAVG